MPLHTIPPVWDTHSEVLILGSFPSVKSREAQFFYAHQQNRFWPLLAQVYAEPVPTTIDEKKLLLLRHHLALWDVVSSCEIDLSSDSTIRSVQPNDVLPLLHAAPIRAILCNGQTAGKLYKRYLENVTGLPALVLPSTSPANAAWRFERLVSVWKEALPQ